MTPASRHASSKDGVELAVQERLSSVNAVLALSLILTQVSSPRQVMRLVTTAVPSIAPGQNALAWHPGRSGDYYQRAPDGAGGALTRLTGPGRIEMGDHSSWWAFPITSPLAHDPLFLVTVGGEPPSDEETFLLTVLAQLCGTVIARLELIAAERTSTERVAALNAELESTVSTLTRIMEIHRRLNEIVADAGEMGIAEALHRLTAFPVLIQDVHGATRAAAGDVQDDHLAAERPGQRQRLIRRLRAGRRAVYHRRAWLVLANPRAGVPGVIALIDPARTASEIDLAALEYAATVLSAELARLQSVADAELRSQAARERDIAQARAAELAASEARQRAIQQELMASRARLVTTSDIARQRVTRDLHDGAQQRFVITLINLQLAEQKWESAPQRARELLGMAVRDARLGLEDLREIAAGIHPAILTQRGLAAAIDALAARLPIPVQLDVPGQRLPAPIEASMYFFCSEALTNVVKHARATSAGVRMELGGDRCAIEVCDDGIGGARPRSETSGLNGLRDRIGALGGTMDITSPATGGTVLRASIPLPGEPAAPA
jgi:signal transduction histidine kinase